MREMKSRIVNRRVKVGFHNGHTLVLPDKGRWVEAPLEECDDEDTLMVPSDIAR